MHSGNVVVQDQSRVAGASNGINFRGGNSPGALLRTLVVDNSSIVGERASAIAAVRFLNFPLSANILIRDGSTLESGNGTILEVGEGVIIDFAVDDSRLVGNVDVAAGGVAAIALRNNAALTGNVTNAHSIQLDDSTFTGAIINGQRVQLNNNATLTAELNQLADVTSSASAINGNINTADSVSLLAGSTIVGSIANVSTLDVASSTVRGNLDAVQNVTLADGSQVNGNITGSANITATGSSITGNLSDNTAINVTAGRLIGQVNNAQLLAINGSTMVGNINDVAVLQATGSNLSGALTAVNDVTLISSALNGNVAGANNIIVVDSNVAGALTDNAAVAFTRGTFTGSVAGSRSVNALEAVVSGDLTGNDSVAFSGGRYTGNLSNSTAATFIGTAITGDIANVGTLGLTNAELIGNLSGIQTANVTSSRLSGTIAAVDNFTGIDSSITGDFNTVGNVALTGSTVTGNVNGASAVTMSGGTLIGNIADAPTVAVSDNALFRGGLSRVGALALKNGGTWEMVGSSSAGGLTMNGGSVVVSDGAGQSFNTLSVGSLAGNGTFRMGTNIAASTGDLLIVAGPAFGTFDLGIRNTGNEPTDGTPPLQVVRTASTDARFAVIGERVDAGAYQYALQQRSDGWYLERTDIPTPSTESALALSNAMPIAWQGELTTMRSRMGDVRLGRQEGGAWARTFGNRQNVSPREGQSFKQDQYGLMLGADKTFQHATGQVAVGVLGGYSKSDVKFRAGTKGDVDSYSLGGYATWMNANGYYVDTLVKYNRFSNEARVSMSDGTRSRGKYSANGIGASVEAGRHIVLRDQMFVEPYAQVAGLHLPGKRYSLDNGLQVDASSSNSVQARLGAAFGKTFDLANGGRLQPYVKIAAVQEFADGGHVNVNDKRFKNDLGGTRGEVGVGIAAQFKPNLQMYADFDYMKGRRIEQPYGFSVGVRYSF